MRAFSIFGCAVLSGLLFVLAMPLGEWSSIVVAAPLPLLFATRSAGLLYGFVGALIMVFTSAMVADAGWFYSDRQHSETSGWIYTGFGLYGFALSISAAIWADRATKRMPAWWFAALSTLLEAALMMEIPAHLVLSQYRQAWAMHLSSLGGIWLASFFLWWAIFAIAQMEFKKSALCGAASIAALMLLSLVPFRTISANPSLSVACLQCDTMEKERLQFAHLEASRVADLVVWPEFGGIMFTSANNPTELKALSNEPGSKPLVTSFPEGSTPLPYNAASLFMSGKESKRYLKRKLFGGERKMHQAGSIAATVDLNGTWIGLNICFDSCFPHVMRDTANLQNGVGLIALPTIDPAAKHNFAAGMHAAYTTFRSAENGVSIARADGFAYSMIVGPNGKIIKEAGAEQSTITATAPIKKHWTPYSAIGDAVLWLCGGLFALGVIRAKQQGRPPVEPVH